MEILDIMGAGVQWYHGDATGAGCTDDYGRMTDENTSRKVEERYQQERPAGQAAR